MGKHLDGKKYKRKLWLVFSWEDWVHVPICVMTELWVLEVVPYACGLFRVVVVPFASVVLSLFDAASGVVAYWSSWATDWWALCGEGKGKA